MLSPLQSALSFIRILPSSLSSYIQTDPLLVVSTSFIFLVLIHFLMNVFGAFIAGMTFDPEITESVYDESFRQLDKESVEKLIELSKN